MTANTSPNQPFPALDIWAGSALGWATAFALALIPVSLALLILAPRVLDGAALWLKPLKFQISMAVLTGTLLVAIAASGLGGSPWLRVPSIAVAATALYELTFLNIQAARGVRSHFNADTIFDRIGGAIMAGGAGVLVLGAALIGAAILVALALKGRAALDEPVLLAFSRITHVPNIAEFSGRLGLEYARYLGGGLDLDGRLWASYIGKSRLGIGPELGNLQGDYIDSGLLVRVGNEQYGGTLSITNLADSEGNRFALGTPFAVMREQVTPLRPRTIRIGVDFSF